MISQRHLKLGRVISAVIYDGKPWGTERWLVPSVLANEKAIGLVSWSGGKQSSCALVAFFWPMTLGFIFLKIIRQNWGKFIATWPKLLKPNKNLPKLKRSKGNINNVELQAVGNSVLFLHNFIWAKGFMWSQQQYLVSLRCSIYVGGFKT